MLKGLAFKDRNLFCKYSAAEIHGRTLLQGFGRVANVFQMIGGIDDSFL